MLSLEFTTYPASSNCSLSSHLRGMVCFLGLECISSGLYLFSPIVLLFVLPSCLSLLHVVLNLLWYLFCFVCFALFFNLLFVW
jgi:hypothetical protein